MSVDAATPRTTETRLTLPYNGTVYTTQRVVSPQKPTPLIGSSMVGELGAAWADSLVIAVSRVPAESANQLQIIHARIPSEADQLATNWNYSTCSMGGQRFPTIQRTVILLASSVAIDTPAKGSAMPVEAGSIFTNQGYILMDRSVVGSGMQLDPVFRVESRSYVKRSTIKSLSIDPLNGRNLISRSDLYYATEIVIGILTMADLAALPANAWWGVQDDGTERTFTQLSCEWYSVTTSDVIAGEYNATLKIMDCGSYYSNDSYYWPPVLETYELMDWDRNDGGTEIYPAIRMNPDGYNGPCKTLIALTWSKTAQVVEVVGQMKPTGIHYSSPYYSVNISECLHGAVAFQCDTRNADPVYKPNTGSTRYFAATEPDSWPETHVAFDDQQPFRGGYLRTKRTVTRPTIPANVVWNTGAAIPPVVP